MKRNKKVFVVRAILVLMIAIGIVMTMAALFPLPDKPPSACCSANSCTKEGHHK
jgi:hypothetical protein